MFLSVTFDLGPHLSELIKGELVAGLGELLDDLSDPVPGQSQVGGFEELSEFVFADESTVVHVWIRKQLFIISIYLWPLNVCSFLTNQSFDSCVSQ